MSNIGPYTKSWLPVSKAAHALANQADTIFDELNASIDRAHAIRAKMKARAAEKEVEAYRTQLPHSIPAPKWPRLLGLVDISRREWTV